MKSRVSQQQLSGVEETTECAGLAVQCRVKVWAVYAEVGEHVGGSFWIIDGRILRMFRVFAGRN